MHITFISTYVPRKCGIATYTRDLSNELRKQGHTTDIFALEGLLNVDKYPNCVKRTIEQDNILDYIVAAKKLNKKNVDFVHVQHEFGIFGGLEGEYILIFAHALEKPLITTFHTVQQNPSPRRKIIIQELARLSKKIIVMEEVAKYTLKTIYSVPLNKIEVIYHGVPSLKGTSQLQARKKLKLNGEYVIISSNLISRNKGIEYVIRCLPTLVKEIPTIRYLIVGETHPGVKLKEGESYRKELEEIVKEHRLENHVTFINKYVTLRELIHYFTASDICITPYLDPQQVTSGTLSYAIGLGRTCVSTPYVYAQRILKEDKGIIVDFNDTDAISDAILYLYNNPNVKKAMEKQAYQLGLKMRWSKVAKKHDRLYTDLSSKFVSIAQPISSLSLEPRESLYLEPLQK